MSTFNGLPAHILLVHFIVVLAPLTAISAILAAVWPTARRRLAWPTLALATAVLILTPVTTDAGEWLEHRVGRNPLLRDHTQLGDTFIFFALALFVAAALLAWVHMRETRGRSLSRILVGLVVVLTIATGIATTVQIYRIGESGSRSTWAGVTTQP